jgi:hypothetical protein
MTDHRLDGRAVSELALDLTMHFALLAGLENPEWLRGVMPDIARVDIDPLDLAAGQVLGLLDYLAQRVTVVRLAGQIHVHEVICGMLVREATFAKDVARAPTLWTGHGAPILLRAMADVYINIAWLLLNPVERCRKFILFGLGQASALFIRN